MILTDEPWSLISQADREPHHRTSPKHQQLTIFSSAAGTIEADTHGRTGSQRARAHRDLRGRREALEELIKARMNKCLTSALNKIICDSSVPRPQICECVSSALKEAPNADHRANHIRSLKGYR
jgi:hypothetical protein